MSVQSGLQLNRREFCLTMGVAAIAGALPQCAEAQIERTTFRARKIFLQRWSNEVSHLRPAARVAVFREKIRQLRMDSDAAILTDLDGVPHSLVRLAESGARDAGLALFVPAVLPGNILERFDRIDALTATTGSVETVPVIPVPVAPVPTKQMVCDGLLFSRSGDGVRFAVLLDASRCSWSAFSCGNIPKTPRAPGADLDAARAIDRALKHMV